MNAHMNKCLSHTCRTRRRRGPSPLPLCRFSCELPDIRLINTHQDILWLDVCVDDLTLCVQVIQALEYLKINESKMIDRVQKLHCIYELIKNKYIKNIYISLIFYKVETN